jgi:membrane-associated phospholipid phosphatase
MLIIVANAISLSAILLFLLPWGFFVATNRAVFLWLGVVASLADGSTKIWKRVFGVEPKVFARPVGACDCDILCRNGDQTGKYGFPSGHMTITSVVMVAFALIYSQWTCVMYAILTICMMGWARHVKRCHNWIQISVGTIYGFFVATFFVSAWAFFTGLS